MVEDRLSTLERAVLLTLAYSDVFDYALDEEEVHKNLVDRATLAEVQAALRRLEPHAIERAAKGLLTLRGRSNIARLRAHRRSVGAAGWRQARRFAGLLAYVPFVRMVAVCGSLAVDNADADSDVDLFLVTAPRRLWLVQAATMVLRRLAPGGSMTICPNYLLAEDDLAVDPRNLFTAHEVTQTVPVLGGEAYRRFRAANAWTEDFLPQARPAFDAPPRPVPAASGAFERILGGRIGDFFDRAMHRALLGYYRLRLRHLGFTRSQITKAYRRGRQTLIGSGFLGTVEARFVTGAGQAVGSESQARRAFRGPSTDPANTICEPHFADVFASRYGGPPA